MGYKTKEWRDHMRVTLDYNNLPDKFLGDKGFTSSLRPTSPRLPPLLPT